MTDAEYIRSRPLIFPAAMRQKAKGTIVDWAHESGGGSWHIRTEDKLVVGQHNKVLTSVDLNEQKDRA